MSKAVVLAIDEMAIKQGLGYDKGRDAVGGFGTSSAKEMADHAIAFLVKGNFNKWKQLIGYFLFHGPMSGPMSLSKLNDIGLYVTVIVCDQGSNTRNLFEKQLE